MKRIVIWLLIVQFATGHNLLGELLRLPILLEHYDAHRTETPNLSFAAFLWLHYYDAQHEQSDSRHAGLPLHCAHGAMAETTLPCPPHLDHPVFGEMTVLRHTLPIADEFLRLTAPLSGVFRPPVA